MFFSTSVHVNGNLLKGIYALLEDKSFLLPTRPAQLVLKTAKLLLEWAPSHILEIECFDKDMAHLFSSCFPKQRAKKGFKGSIWQKYHMLRTSDTYISLWRRFIQTSIGVDLSPIFIQYVGHHGFKEALKNQFPVEHIYVDRAGVHNELTYQELNAVRYAAGFVPRALKKSLLKKLKQRPTANKATQDYILCLESLISNDDDNEQQHCSSDWVNSINRGGLACVNNMTFELFFTMECVLRTQLEYNPIHLGKEAVRRITESEDVLFCWCIISTSWDDDCSTALLDMIAKMWSTIRGFSYASAWVDKIKVAQQQTTQKSKGFRKTLNS